MNAETLRALQAPLKTRYRDDPTSAKRMLKAIGHLGTADITCIVQTSKGPLEAGLHPATGGDGSFACSGDMLLEALIGCAGVTLMAVATAMKIPIRKGTVRAEGDLDFRGTMGVNKDVDVGFQAIRMFFDLDTDATSDQLQMLIKLTERYCVVYQTLKKTPAISTHFSA